MSGVDERQQMMCKRMLACVVMAGGDVVLLRLEGEGAATTTDEDLVRRVADSLQVNDRQRPEMGGEVELSAGIRGPIGAGILRAGEGHPLRSGRRWLRGHSVTRDRRAAAHQ